MTTKSAMHFCSLPDTPRSISFSLSMTLRSKTLGHIAVKRLVLFILMGSIAAVSVSASAADIARAAEPSFKGIELYSWQDTTGTWRYSLLTGTNRSKAEAEIVAVGVVINDTTLLKRRLAMLAVNEEVMWVIPDAARFSLPDSSIVEDLVAYARTVRINLRVLE